MRKVCRVQTPVRKLRELERQIADDSIKASEIDPRLVKGYRSFYNRETKRLIDSILAGILLILVSPVMIAVSAAIFLEDGMPVLYRAERGGFHGRSFRIFKFRSMVKNADKVGGGTTALNDDRITRVGAIIRKLKVDEFPNLFNILTGEMSFIGPRPELLQYTRKYEGTEKLILEVRPGITDYSSIEFINLDEIVGQGDADAMYEERVLPRKNKLRVKYAATVSFMTDLRLFILTVMKVLEKGFDFTVRKGHR